MHHFFKYLTTLRETYLTLHYQVTTDTLSAKSTLKYIRKAVPGSARSDT